MEELIPTESEIRKWLLSTLQHVCHVEYFLGKLRIGHDDPERPHDLIGPGNKYEWEVIKGLALQYREPGPDFETYILPSLEIHRQQYHHRKWNNPAQNDETKPVPDASEDNLLLGAIDTICSLLENRTYQNSYNYKDISRLKPKFCRHKVPWILEARSKMVCIRQPNFEEIVSLRSFQNIGLEKKMYNLIKERVDETIDDLKRRYGFSI